jgi:hypothetical protein
MIERADLVKDNLKTMKFKGVVEDNNDTLKKGRCKIRIFGKFDELAIDEIPWAVPVMSSTIYGSDGGSGALSVPKNGSIVECEFDNGNLYSPKYYAGSEVSTDVLEIINNSYLDSHVLLADKTQDVKVFYTKNIGFQIYLKGSFMTIANDGTVNIEHKDTSSVITLQGGTISITSDSEINLTSGSRIKASAPEVWLDGKETKTGHDPIYSQVLAEPLWNFLSVLASAVDAKMYVTPGVLANAAEVAKKLSTSDTCKISK